MRRIKILFYWLFKDKNNVSFSQLIKFLTKAKVKEIGSSFIDAIQVEGNAYKVKFHSIPEVLYWPKIYGMDGIYQVSAETFDKNDWHYYQAISRITDSEILLDVGAAEGLFALSVIDKCDKVILIEPNQHFVNTLKNTFQGFSDKVSLLSVAVGEEDGSVKFSEDSLSGGVSTGNTLAVDVEMKRIDDLIHPELKISFFKADIEGFELSMLKGARQTIARNKPKISITSYHDQNNANEIIELVKSFVPEYNVYKKGIIHTDGKPVMIHFWV